MPARALAAVVAAAAAVRAASTDADLPSTAARLRAVDDWLVGAEAPPAWWRVRGTDSVVSGTTLKNNGRKDVVRATLNGSTVIVKSFRGTNEIRAGGALVDSTNFELYYLEALRGEPGVPALLGGWRAGERLTWVVEDAGRVVGAGFGFDGNPVTFAAAYDAPSGMLRGVHKLCL